MSWVHIAEGKMLDSLNHLHSEVVFNAATTIAQRQDITVDEVEKLLDLIEREVANLLRFDTCEFAPCGLGDMLKCSACGWHLDTTEVPDRCPYCGRLVIQRGQVSEGSQ